MKLSVRELIKFAEDLEKIEVDFCQVHVGIKISPSDQHSINLPENRDLIVDVIHAAAKDFEDLLWRSHAANEFTLLIDLIEDLTSFEMSALIYKGNSEVGSFTNFKSVLDTLGNHEYYAEFLKGNLKYHFQHTKLCNYTPRMLNAVFGAEFNLFSHPFNRAYSFDDFTRENYLKALPEIRLEVEGETHTYDEVIGY